MRSTTPAQQPDRVRAIDSFFATWNAPGSPGCAVGVSRNGQRVLQRHYGTANIETREPITDSTVFDVASLSKQLTAAAILTLVQDGRLSLSDDIRRYVPEVPDYGATITIDHLITHTNGLRDWNNVAYLGGLRIETVPELLDLVARQRAPNFRAGEQFLYSNTAFALAAIIVSRVSGEPFAQFTRRRLFAPLGMTSTTWRGDAVRPRALAYRKTASGFELSMPTSQIIGSAGLLTTVGDLLRWEDALANDRGLPFSAAKLQEEARLNDGRKAGYARGLFVGEYRGFKEIHHDGGDFGYRAWSGRYPAAGLSIAMLCNTYVGDVIALGRRVADQMLPSSRVAAAAPSSAVNAEGSRLAPSEVQQLAGTFISDELGLPLFLTADGDRLNVEGSYATRVAPQRFAVPWAELVFQDSDVLRLIKSEADRQTLRRVPGPLATAAEVTAMAGRYRSPDVGATYVAESRDSLLVMHLEDRPSYGFTFKPIGHDVFQAGSVIARVWRNAAGGPSALVLSTTRVHELRFDRVPD